MGAKPAKKAIIQLDVLGVKIPIGEVRSFQIETALGTIDVSTLSTDWKKYLVGQAGWSASMELFYDPSDEGQEELVTRALAGEPCSFRFLPFGADEVYKLSLDTPTGGTFTLGDGDTIETDAMGHDSSASEIQTAIREAYSNNAIFVAEDGADFLISFPTGVEASLKITTDLLTYEVTGEASCVLQDPLAVYVGTGSIAGWAPSGATEDAVGVSISVQGNGELLLNPEEES